jgi:ABC-type multidrug transport system fused ATPase/permease subunit
MPLLLVAYNYILYKYIGLAYTIGVVVMIISLIINYYYRTQFSKYLKLHMKKTDLRMKVTTEMLNNLKAIKLNGWDDVALAKIQEARGEELEALGLRYYVTTISQTLLWFAPIAMSVASIGLYQYLNKDFKIEDIFTSLGIFTSFQGLIKNLPTTLDVIVETLISLGRIEKFLALPEVDDTTISKYDDDTMKKNIVLQISNGSFSWNKNFLIEKSNTILDNNKNENVTKEKKGKKNIKRTNTYLELKKLKINKNGNSFSSEESEEEQKVKNLIEKEPDNENKEDSSSSNSKNDSDDALSVNDSKRYLNMKKKYALKNINFTVKEGEFVCIIGEVGSGKSSLVQALLNNMV